MPDTKDRQRYTVDSQSARFMSLCVSDTKNTTPYTYRLHTTRSGGWFFVSDTTKTTSITARRPDLSGWTTIITTRHSNLKHTMRVLTRLDVTEQRVDPVSQMQQLPHPRLQLDSGKQSRLRECFHGRWPCKIAIQSRSLKGVSMVTNRGK